MSKTVKIPCVCDVCKEESYCFVEDLGIGPYEYWGAPGVDEQLVVSTDCCWGEAMFRGTGEEITVKKFQDYLERERI